MRLGFSFSFLCVGKDTAVVEGDLQQGVFAVEIVLQAVEVSATFPMTHRQIVEQVVATSLGGGGGHFVLDEDPFQALDGQLAHVLDTIDMPVKQPIGPT